MWSPVLTVVLIVKFWVYTFSPKKKLAIEANFNKFFTRETLINPPWSTLNEEDLWSTSPGILSQMSDVAEVRQLGQPYNIGSVEELALVYIMCLSFCCFELVCFGSQCIWVCLGRKTMENQFLLTIPGIVSLATCDFWLENYCSHKNVLLPQSAGKLLNHLLQRISAHRLQ